MSWGTELLDQVQSSFYIYENDGAIGVGFVGFGEYHSYDTETDSVTPKVGGDCEASVVGPVYHVMLAFDTSGDNFEQEIAPGSGLFRTHHLTMKCVVNGVAAAVVDRLGQSEPDLIGEGHDVMFPVAWSGYEIGIPVAPSTADQGSKITIGQVQVWVGQFIDPTNSSNYEKFVELRDGGGYQVDASVAADAFGDPTYCFFGGNESFPINRGTGGAFSASGVINTRPGLAY